MAAVRAGAIRADELGYDLIYTWDHFIPLYGEPDGPHFECWSLLASWAEGTSAWSSGRWSACISYRNPHLLADMARTSTTSAAAG